MKKLLTILITTIICISAVLWIFSSLKQEKSSQNEVIFWTLQMSDFSDYMNGVISEFEAQNPEIKI